jgi:hypothetical protein
LLRGRRRSSGAGSIAVPVAPLDCFLASRHPAIQVQTDRVAADDRASARNFAAPERDHTACNLAYIYTVARFAVIRLEFLLAARQIRLDDGVNRAGILAKSS